MYLYYASTKKKNSNISPIEIVFDLTKSKKYIPWESYKSTIGASYFTTFNYSSSNKDYSFTCNSFFSIENNRLTVNTEGLELGLKKLEEAATSPSHANRNAAFSSSSQLKIIVRLAQAYAETFNDLMDKIESHIPDTASDKTQIINNIFTKLRTKKIFVDEGAEVFNKILLDKITNELSKLFDNKQESVSKKELQEFYNYLDSKECKIPFSTKMGKPEKLKNMMDFIESSKEYKEYSKSAKPIQGNKSEYALSDMLHIAVQNSVRIY
ncbi:MAG: hypothetical protein sL5_06620 [Candidatus Mesenet longicola]|uniref:Uncharacterized protein n=1 Tax=Candidatus Mesenet longicola TaxID=1892558 RepID=A0A8J3HVB0_9RICK|nr:MAG: hypothetical protein sGL2_06680 [Candidatus Mesenet longicola]GHM59669.1 MAG: hypothetical protein sL5_06620 [Candidatus Mesenet longicola]